MDEPSDTLTEKEKQTLRLIGRGHDAKTAARTLDLSVHTINERLRGARRKLGVTSSREAARVLLNAERDRPENLVSKQLGEASRPSPDDKEPHRGGNLAPWIGGSFIMSVLAAIAVFALAGAYPASNQLPAAEPAEAVASADAERENAARGWLTLVDAAVDAGVDDGDWEVSFEAAGSAFRAPNTVETWQAVSEQARGPLGAVLSREVIAINDIASPERYQQVQFRSDFANRKGVIESVTLQRENGELRVVGYFIN
ncbi:DUF4019 domain-containing protein [Qipengyuania sp. ASV99]|uniref:helix-turn-helix domain-containing protein n=1 Tax=Qipengyuania sp. ASV99 TaxID=3399681 RepID=UPI003A4C7C15